MLDSSLRAVAAAIAALANEHGPSNRFSAGEVASRAHLMPAKVGRIGAADAHLSQVNFYLTATTVQVARYEKSNGKGSVSWFICEAR